jgi:hypothetical protein
VWKIQSFEVVAAVVAAVAEYAGVAGCGEVDDGWEAHGEGEEVFQSLASSEPHDCALVGLGEVHQGDPNAFVAELVVVEVVVVVVALVEVVVVDAGAASLEVND